MEINRSLILNQINFSCFLFGPRQTGKTWLLQHTVNSDIYIDLLNKKEQLRYTKDPSILFSEIAGLKKKNLIIIIDEVQKVPGLLDEVHRAIESEWEPQFFLTGSSARKLKRNQANMLGGRAVTFQLFPFSYFELKEIFSLNNYLKFGGLPNIYLAKNDSVKKMLLESYVRTYLKEEIIDEALTRNLPAFSRFLDLAAFENGNIINYSNIAREIGVSSNTIKEYFNILADTQIGFFLLPFFKSHRKKLINHSKFYFVDTGISFALKKILSVELTEGTPLFGDAFEHFIILETKKALSYSREEINLYFFRTFDGAEVDLILEKHGKIIAVEVKSSEMPQKLTGLRSFRKDHNFKKAICVCRTPRIYEKNGITFLPWQNYVEQLNGQTLFE